MLRESRRQAACCSRGPGTARSAGSHGTADRCQICTAGTGFVMRVPVEVASASTRQLSILAAPLFCAEALDGCVVACLPRARVVSVFRSHGVGQVLRKDAAYGVQRVVARQSFVRQAVHGPCD